MFVAFEKVPLPTPSGPVTLEEPLIGTPDPLKD